jgi:hypothetical protein
MSTAWPGVLRHYHNEFTAEAVNIVNVDQTPKVTRI